MAKFLYQRAGAGSQPEVMAAIARFRALPASIRARVPSLWGWLLGPEGTPPYKIDRREIQWLQRPHFGARCGNCHRWYIHAATGTGICDSVAGVWREDWWCDRWTPAGSPAAYETYQR